MGFNIAGLIIKSKIDEAEVEKLIGHRIVFLSEVGYEEATSAFRREDTIDVLQTANGTLIIIKLGHIYDVGNFEGEIIQFMISDVSDTYYFEKYSNKKLDRKYIISQGEIYENIGQGFVDEEDDRMDMVRIFIDEYLQIDFNEKMFELKFKQYKLEEGI